MYKLIKIVVASLSILWLLFFSFTTYFLRKKQRKSTVQVSRAVPHDTPYDLWLAEAKEEIELLILE